MGQICLKSHPELQQRAQWEWKSNPNPFSTSEQPQWTAYPPLDNFRLEDAFSENRSEVDLGNQIVSLKDKLQKSKGNNYKQRPVRRNTEYFNNKPEETKQIEGENIRGDRFFGVELPKTKNQMFGSLSDYLSFFELRSPEIQEFARLLQEIEVSKDLDQLNKVIIPCLVNSIQAESKKKSGQKGGKKIFTLFEKEVTSFEDFYERVLKAYTLNSFLYKKVNYYLLSENWIEVNCLLPYIYCLCKAFFHPQFTPSQNNPSQSGSMVLYRGSRFNVDAIRSYNKMTTKYFAWNSLTSTSRSRSVAENFWIQKKEEDRKKTPVMFLIEVPLNPESVRSTDWIDIRPFSAIPEEDEVVLAPGSVFELKGTHRYHQYTEVYLRLINNGEKLVHLGQILHGAMHSEMAKDKEMKIVCLEGEELFTAISHLKGNELIEELEFCSCKFNKKILTYFADTLKTVPKLRKLTLISPSSADQTHFSFGFEQLKDAQIQINELEIDDHTILSSQRAMSFSKGISCFPKLQLLNLDLSFSLTITEKGLSDLCSQGIRKLISLQSLTLNFMGCTGISDEGLEILCFQGIKHLTSLISLNLNFNKCYIVTAFNPAWRESKKVTDKALNGFSQLIQQLGSLTSLTLDFSDWADITDEGLICLFSQGIQRLLLLRSLDISFKSCRQITDKGLESLWSQGIQNLPSLVSLSLNFSDCDQITDQGLQDLCSQGINKISSLESVTLDLYLYYDFREEWKDDRRVFKGYSCWPIRLDLESCKKMTYDRIQNIRSQMNDKGIEAWVLHLNQPSKIAIHRIKSLETTSKLPVQQSHRDLNMKHFLFKKEIGGGNSEIRQNSLETLLEKRDQTLTQTSNNKLEILIDNRLLRENQEPSSVHEVLTNESLIPIIEHVGVHLAQNMSHLKSIASFVLKINGNPEITDEILNDISLLGIKHLTSLTSLNLTLQRCEKITLKGLNKLWCQSFQPLISLRSLSVSFRFSEQATDEVLNSLCSQWMESLTSLLSLELKFEHSDKVTDQGLIICSQGIQRLVSLTSLNLCLSHCEQITNFGLKNLGQGLKHLALLTSLTLDFGWCQQITDDGLNNLCSEGIGSLTSLTSLDLNPFIEALSKFFFEISAKMTSIFVDFANFHSFWTIGMSYIGNGPQILNIFWKVWCPISGTYPSEKVNFSGCFKITNEGLDSCSQGIKPLASLTNLALHFIGCEEITEKRLQILCPKGVKNQILLTSLTLDFAGCQKIPDEGLFYLGSKGIKFFSSLQSLNLNFLCCQNITNDGLNNFAKGLKHLQSLTSLTLNFRGCKKITDSGVDSLFSKGIRDLASLTFLSLDLSWCDEITDSGLYKMCSQGIKYLTSLTSLTLQFCTSKKITDIGLNHLCSQGIKGLTLLESLNLDFNNCNEITDDGLNHLCSQGIGSLTKLTSLTLSFAGCRKITEKTCKNFHKILKYFGYEPCQPEDDDNF